MRKKKDKSPKGKCSRWILLGISILVSGVMMLYTFTFRVESNVRINDSPSPEPLRPVSVLTTAPLTHQASIRVLGEVTPLWHTTLRAQVTAGIASISKNLRRGALVKKGERLVSLDRSEYEAQLAAAKSRAAQARVALLTEEREAKEARADWRHSGLEGEPESALVLHEPQLETAKNQLNAALALLKQAEKNLSYTQITAPFDGLVVERDVDPGEILFAGDRVATLMGVEKAEIVVHLDQAQWRLLPSPWKGQKTTLKDPETGAAWQATMARDGGRLDRGSRLRAVYLEISRPYEQNPVLLPGSFVQVELPGKTLKNVLRTPQQALTPEGFLWFVNEANLLERFRASPLFFREEHVYVSAPGGLKSPLRIVAAPSRTFVSGTKVHPVEKEERRDLSCIP